MLDECDLATTLRSRPTPARLCEDPGSSAGVIYTGSTTGQRAEGGVVQLQPARRMCTSNTARRRWPARREPCGSPYDTCFRCTPGARRRPPTPWRAMTTSDLQPVVDRAIPVLPGNTYIIRVPDLSVAPATTRWSCSGRVRIRCFSLDCNENGIPDECEPDCNGNGIPDECDLATSTSQDCNATAFPTSATSRAGRAPTATSTGFLTSASPTATTTAWPTSAMSPRW